VVRGGELPWSYTPLRGDIPWPSTDRFLEVLYFWGNTRPGDSLTPLESRNQIENPGNEIDILNMVKSICESGMMVLKAKRWKVKCQIKLE